jgi:predicted RNase H-like nuclease
MPALSHTRNALTMHRPSKPYSLFFRYILCDMQPIPHRVYIHAHHYKDSWTVQYLEEDLKTPVGRMYCYSRIDQVREILKRADCLLEQWAKFEEGIRCWGIGACYLDLSSDQYKKLK